jgi:hypothetical protein
MPEGFAMKALNPDTQILCEYKALSNSSDGKHWIDQFCHEMGRLLQGYTNATKTTKGTGTGELIQFADIPHDRKKDITYCRVVVTDRPKPKQNRRVQITGAIINFPHRPPI